MVSITQVRPDDHLVPDQTPVGGCLRSLWEARLEASGISVVPWVKLCGFQPSRLVTHGGLVIEQGIFMGTVTMVDISIYLSIYLYIYILATQKSAEVRLCVMNEIIILKSINTHGTQQTWDSFRIHCGHPSAKSHEIMECPRNDALRNQLVAVGEVADLQLLKLVT